MEVSKNPISEARAIAKGAFWKIIGIFAFNVILLSIISYFFVMLVNLILNTDSAIFIANFTSWHNPATRNYGMIILYQLLVNIVDIVMAPLFICLLTTLFSSLKARNDLIYQPRQVYSPVKEMNQETYPKQQEIYEIAEDSSPRLNIQIKGKFYCPFCGHFISTYKKLCDNCGESFEFIK
jgi:hypothetical protein